MSRELMLLLTWAFQSCAAWNFGSSLDVYNQTNKCRSCLSEYLLDAHVCTYVAT